MLLYSHYMQAVIEHCQKCFRKLQFKWGIGDLFSHICSYALAWLLLLFFRPNMILTRKQRSNYFLLPLERFKAWITTMNIQKSFRMALLLSLLEETISIVGQIYWLIIFSIVDRTTQMHTIDTMFETSSHGVPPYSTCFTSHFIKKRPNISFLYWWLVTVWFVACPLEAEMHGRLAQMQCRAWSKLCLFVQPLILLHLDYKMCGSIGF